MGYPHWFMTAPVVGSLPVGRLQWKVWNRTGSASVKGKIYQFDMGFTTTSTSESTSSGVALSAVTSFLWGNSESCWRNVVLPATAYLRHGIFCLAEEAVADNDEMLVTVVGPGTLVAAKYTASDGSNPPGYYNPENGTATPAQALATTSKVIFLGTANVTVSSNVAATVTGMFNGFGF